MPQLAQGIEPGTGAVSVLAGRVLADDELIGLRGIDEQLLPFQALPAQHRHLGLHITAGAALAVDLGQLQRDPRTITHPIGAVSVVQMVVH